MQFKKGFNKKESCYLAILKQSPDEEVLDPISKEAPKEIQVVLMDYKDLMPKELPKKLPPRREVDHRIELEPGTKPPSMAPYHMSSPEL